MTAEIRSINPPISPEPITHDNVTPAYFQKTWAENRSRVLEFLSQGFGDNISETVNFCVNLHAKLSFSHNLTDGNNKLPARHVIENFLVFFSFN